MVNRCLKKPFFRTTDESVITVFFASTKVSMPKQTRTVIFLSKFTFANEKRRWDKFLWSRIQSSSVKFLKNQENVLGWSEAISSNVNPPTRRRSWAQFWDCQLWLYCRLFHGALQRSFRSLDNAVHYLCYSEIHSLRMKNYTFLALSGALILSENHKLPQMKYIGSDNPMLS